MLSLQLSLFIQHTLGTWKSPGECDESALPSNPRRRESDRLDQLQVFSSRCFSGLKIQQLPVKGKLIKDRPEERRGGGRGEVW